MNGYLKITLSRLILFCFFCMLLPSGQIPLKAFAAPDIIYQACFGGLSTDRFHDIAYDGPVHNVDTAIMIPSHETLYADPRG